MAESAMAAHLLLESTMLCLAGDGFTCCHHLVVPGGDEIWW